MASLEGRWEEWKQALHSEGNGIWGRSVMDDSSVIHDL